MIKRKYAGRTGMILLLTGALFLSACGSVGNGEKKSEESTVEENTIGLWVYTGYADAQSWRVSENGDGTFCLQTPYESGRVITLREGTGAFLCTRGADGVQNWLIEPVK